MAATYIDETLLPESIKEIPDNWKGSGLYTIKWFINEDKRYGAPDHGTDPIYFETCEALIDYIKQVTAENDYQIYAYVYFLTGSFSLIEAAFNRTMSIKNVKKFRTFSGTAAFYALGLIEDYNLPPKMQMDIQKLWEHYMDKLYKAYPLMFTKEQLRGYLYGYGVDTDVAAIEAGVPIDDIVSGTDVNYPGLKTRACEDPFGC